MKEFKTRPLRGALTPEIAIAQMAEIDWQGFLVLGIPKKIHPEHDPVLVAIANLSTKDLTWLATQLNILIQRQMQNESARADIEDYIK